jgi:hypothetical protein
MILTIQFISSLRSESKFMWCALRSAYVVRWNKVSVPSFQDIGWLNQKIANLQCYCLNIYIYSVTAEFNIFTSILFVAIMLLAIYIPPEIKIFHHLSSLWSPGNGSSTRRREFSYNDHELFETVTPFFFSADFCPGNLIISSPSLISCLLVVSTRFLVFVEVPKP